MTSQTSEYIQKVNNDRNKQRQTLDPIRGHSFDDARTPDTQYGQRPWTNKPRYSYLGPFDRNEERLVQQALSVMEMSSEEIQEVVGSPLSQIQQFPARLGYERTDVTVDSILGVSRNFPTKISWFSGSSGGFSATSRNSLGGSI